MGINPGNPAFALPPGEDSLVRQVKDLERTTRENLASVVNSFKSTVTRLDAAIASTIAAETHAHGVLNVVFTPTDTQFVALDFVVPDGFTSALMIAQIVVAGFNNSGGSDYLYGSIRVSDGAYSGEAPQHAAVSITASVSVPFYSKVVGLSAGDTVTISAHAHTFLNTWNFGSNANVVNLYAQALFLK